jgi:hypothetical protein
MKKFAQLFCVAIAAMLCPVASQSAKGQATEVIAFWDFDNGFVVPDESAQIVHPASIGTGTIYQQRADTDGNGKGGNAYTNVLLGIDVDGDRSIAWDDFAKSGSDNDGELFLEFSTSGFENIQISFDIRGNAEGGFSEYDLKYDTSLLTDIAFNGTTIKDFAGGTSTTLANNSPIATSATDFQRELIDLSGELAANDQAAFTFRFDDFEGNDDVRLDNFLVTGTPIGVPEPSTALLLMLASTHLFARRRASR